MLFFEIFNRSEFDNGYGCENVVVLRIFRIYFYLNLYKVDFLMDCFFLEIVIVFFIEY